ncbi:hypothetical protein, partial [Hymenobacter saemangeumensis]|uniref:hypothetical protein n=1 Tax=Hymenobacter saemangeumensis TaxID=1084522 RepID=UPI0031EEFF16
LAGLALARLYRPVAAQNRPNPDFLNSFFSIFNDSLLTDTLARRDMYQYEGTEESTDICPMFFKPDYGIMHFVCVRTTAKAYRVLINFSVIKYLPRTKEYKFWTWDEYILSSYGIRRATETANRRISRLPLRKMPQSKADTLAIPAGHEMFCPQEVKGDWLKVRYDCFYNQPRNPHEGQPCQEYIDKCKTATTGWLQWKQDNTVLIDIMLMP